MNRKPDWRTRHGFVAVGERGAGDNLVRYCAIT